MQFFFYMKFLRAFLHSCFATSKNCLVGFFHNIFRLFSGIQEFFLMFADTPDFFTGSLKHSGVFGIFFSCFNFQDSFFCLQTFMIVFWHIATFLIFFPAVLKFWKTYTGISELQLIFPVFISFQAHFLTFGEFFPIYLNFSLTFPNFCGNF